MPQLSPRQIAQVSGLVAQYIAARRERFYPQAAPLAAAQKAAMSGFFLPQVLDAARVLVLFDRRVENPPLYPTLAGTRRIETQRCPSRCERLSAGKSNR